MTDDATVENLLMALNITGTELIVTVNDTPVNRSHRLNDGDIVSIYPPIAGGNMRL